MAVKQGRVCFTGGAFKCVPLEIYEILYKEKITESREILSNYETRNSAKFRGILGNARNTEETEVEFPVDEISRTS
jgi:hypothetical protein